MTEKELQKCSIHCLKFLAELAVCEECDCYTHEDCKEVALYTLRKLEKYRSMENKLSEAYGENNGLLEKLVDYTVKLKEKNHPDEMPEKTIMLTDEDVDRWKKYKELGTVEEVTAAVDKQNIKKTTEIGCECNCSYFICPSCGKTIYTWDDYKNYKHCLNCGQAIDWTEEVEENEKI